jgi:hypothetical protein
VEAATLNAVALQYNAAGRRIKNAAGTSFLFDGANAAQQLSGTAVTANLLSGGLDEIFTRTDSSILPARSRRSRTPWAAPLPW